MKPAPLNQNAILTALRGHKLRIPNLTHLFQRWPAARTNSHYHRAIPLVDQAIDRIAVAQPLVAKRRRDDIALLTALWYPQAGRHVMQTLAVYAVWLVCWDDCVDANEGDLAGDYEAAERWRGRTVDVVRRILEVGGKGRIGEGDAVNEVFQDFATPFIEKASMVQRQHLFDELRFFIECCAVEQKLRLENTIPDYDSYIPFRIGTVAGRTLCSLVEYASQEELPPSIANSPLRSEMWDQVSILLSLMNDLLSLKKELHSECVINAVAALLAPEKSIDDVVREVEEKLKWAVGEFDRVADGLVKLVEDDEVKKGVVMRYVDGCRAVVTGTLEFMLKSPRYNISKLLQEDGSLELTL